MIYFLDTFNYILRTWKAVFFTEPILLTTLIIAFVISVRFGKGKKGLVLVPYYIVLFILEILSEYIAAFMYYHKIFNPKEFDFVCYLDYLLTIMELFTFIIFFHSEIKSNKAKNILLLFSSLFCVYFLIELILDSKFPVSVSDNTQSRVYTIEAIILLGGCSSYFIGVFRNFPFKNIKREPSFWVATGLLFFFSCTLPYSLSENYMRKINYKLMINFYSIFYIFYTILFFMIIKAYLCQQKKSI
jgi:hypothetical protein